MKEVSINPYPKEASEADVQEATARTIRIALTALHAITQAPTEQQWDLASNALEEIMQMIDPDGYWEMSEPERLARFSVPGPDLARYPIPIPGWPPEEE